MELYRQLRPIGTPPPRLKVSEWAEAHRYISGDYSAQPGRYSLDIVPYAREPMDCANDETVRMVVLMWAAQTTKTTSVENVLWYHATQDPCPILMVQPTVEMAQTWSKQKAVPTIRDSPILHGLISEAKARYSGNTIQLKNFPGGSLAIVGANSPSGLASRSCRVVLLDEVDRFPSSAGTEGDPVALAIKRMESFFNGVCFLTSTPTVKGLSRIEDAYEQTDKRQWFVPCETCGTYQTMVWAGLRWPPKDPANAWYQCEKCEAHWTDVQRVAAIRAGEWRPTAPFNGQRGYFLSGLYSPFKAKRGFVNRLHQMAVDFLESRGNPEQEKTWTNTFMAETWAAPSEKIDPVPLMARTEKYTPDTLPAGVLMVVAGADVQKDRIEMEWLGVGMNDETWGIEVMKTYGDTEKPDTWQRFGNAVSRMFKRDDDVMLQPVAVAIDFHYKPSVVKNFCGRAGTKARLIPVIGIGATQPHMTFMRRSKDFVHYTIATDQAKDTIFQRLHIDEVGPRYCQFPMGYGYDENWFKQLTCEQAVERAHLGFKKRVYEKQKWQANEALDMRVYSLAAIDILAPQYEQVKLSLVKTGDKPKPAPARPSFVGGRRAGFVNSWR